MRVLLLLLLLLLLLPVFGCVSHTASSLVGSMRLTMDAPGSAPLSVDGPPGKLRAQIDDDGKTCVLSAEVTSEDRSLILQITTYGDEVQQLIAGQGQSIAASDHHTRALAVNAATIYITSGSDTFYATGGTLTVAPLPAAKGSLHMDVDVTLMNFSKPAAVKLTGTIDATFIGATRGQATHACPAIPDVPKGLIF